MKDIFDENASLFESYKSQFEEHLQHVTQKLLEDIEEIVPIISVINDMTETEKLRKYKGLVTDFLQSLACFEDYVKWINKEEKLFKLAVSMYPVVEELKNFVAPFAELLT